MESTFQQPPEEQPPQLDFDARMVLPLTDDEIRELYFEAQATLDEPPVADADPASELFRRLQLIDLSVVVAAVFLWIVTTATSTPTTPNIVWIATVAVIVVGAILAKLGERWPIGPLSLVQFLWMKANRQRFRRSEPDVDLTDEGVLRLVVRYLTEAPIRKAEQLCTQVEAQRYAIRDSLTEMRDVVSSIGSELESTEDSSVRLLLESKKETARRCIQKLRSLEAELARQGEQAIWAVRPLRELSEKFDRISRVSASLARIQQAHGLIEETEEAIGENRVQLHLLQSISLKAAARLREIEQMVNAHEAAKAEVEAL
jgi:hypothetical protein